MMLGIGVSKERQVLHLAASQGADVATASAGSLAATAHALYLTAKQQLQLYIKHQGHQGSSKQQHNFLYTFL